MVFELGHFGGDIDRLQEVFGEITPSQAEAGVFGPIIDY